jgi:hypothetical protein
MTSNFNRTNSARKEKEYFLENLVSVDKQMRSLVVGVDRVEMRFGGSEREYACFRGVA